MATRSTIAVVHKDGTVSQVYCHWDGYLDHNGQILFEEYNSLEKAEALVAMGDISSLGIQLGEKHSFDWHRDDKELFDQYGEMWSTFYGRDRGEPGCESRRFESLQDYLEKSQEEEYDYLFAGEWLVRFHRTGSERIPLTDALDQRVDLAV